MLYVHTIFVSSDIDSVLVMHPIHCVLWLCGVMNAAAPRRFLVVDGEVHLYLLSTERERERERERES
jgi:hypothetical protein